MSQFILIVVLAVVLLCFLLNSKRENFEVLKCNEKPNPIVGKGGYCTEPCDCKSGYCTTNIGGINGNNKCGKHEN